MAAMTRLAASRGAWMALCMLACVSTRVDPIASPGFTPHEDERSLWLQADQIDASLENEGRLLRDAELERYLDAIAQRLLEASGTSALPVHVRVLRDPYANAFALPNGSLYLHSGLIAPMESEAQVAWVIGHELTHFTHRHGLREQRAQQNRDTARTVAVSIVGVLAAAGGDPYTAFTLLHASNDLAHQVVRLQVAGYSRDMESEADARSLQLLRAAGYDPSQALVVLELLGADADASDATIPYVYASHPKIEERIASLTELLDDPPPGAGPFRTGDAFEERIANLLLANAELELATHALVPAQRGLERYVRLRPSDPEGFRLLAEAHRRAGPERDHVTRAADTLERAAALAPDDASIQRELGLLYRELGERDRAQANLTRYLALAPEAADRAIIERYVAELE
jgi:predicted Zn-dependent protease